MLGGLDRTAGEISRFSEMTGEGFGVRLVRKQDVLGPRLASGQGYLPLHFRCIALKKCNPLLHFIQERVLELVSHRLLKGRLRFIDMIQVSIILDEVAVRDTAVLVQPQGFEGFGDGFLILP